MGNGSSIQRGAPLIASRAAWKAMGAIVVIGCIALGTSTEVSASAPATARQEAAPMATEKKVATFGNGCFWCTEAVFAEVKGVEKVESGYTGGTVANPTYKQVCTGMTGHAEAVRITYDPAVISYEELLEIFWKTHDPTTLNQQGFDVGTQYRSAIFVHDDEQRQLAEDYKKKLDEAGIWNRPIVTTIEEADVFYVAEDYHQDYFKLNPRAGYCRQVIVPKMNKFRRVFKDKLKSEEDESNDDEDR